MDVTAIFKEKIINTKENQMALGLIPLSKWNEYYDYPTNNALKQLVFKNTNGFNDVIRYIGKRRYIHVADFQKWVEISNKKVN